MRKNSVFTNNTTLFCLPKSTNFSELICNTCGLDGHFKTLKTGYGKIVPEKQKPNSVSWVLKFSLYCDIFNKQVVFLLHHLHHRNLLNQLENTWPNYFLQSLLLLPKLFLRKVHLLLHVQQNIIHQ